MAESGLLPGVHIITATPFLPDESLDEASVATLVAACAAAGAEGMVILGVMGEADRLSDAERERVIDRFVAENAGRMQITVGVTAAGTHATRERARDAVRRGAQAVMVSPAFGMSAGPSLRDHFQRIGDGLAAPVVVQDHPPSSGVKMPIAFIAELAEVLPPGSSAKLEDPPTSLRMAELRSLTDALSIYGGSGGVYLLPELDAGADGAMTGFALLPALVQIVRDFRGGNREAARATYERLLPLMLLESQPGLATGIRKEILRRNGALAHPTVRQPAPPLTPTTLAELDKLLDELSRPD
ncbi:MAG: dihydrodipicolinate synthase family protein [Thermomicrobiales bacterium]